MIIAKKTWPEMFEKIKSGKKKLTIGSQTLMLKKEIFYFWKKD